MKRTLATLFLASASTAFAQSPAFETASVKPNVTHETNGEGRARSSVNATPGYLTIHNSTLSQCIQWAYNVSAFQIAGPAWIDSERYDISARAPGAAGKEQLRPMLQNLLAERLESAIRCEM
jgi:uncharacterized protein (TIGR03435 family)